jgi:Domain of unknown function (DUF4926)
MLHEYDVVALKKEWPGMAVPALSERNIVYVHDVNAQAYIVEFFDENGKTIEVSDVVGDEHLELIREDKEI